jgi:polyisoprenyl-phosphate glycosyltransferase
MKATRPTLRKDPLQHICVVSPVYNEEAGIETFFQELKLNLEQAELAYQVVFVDDGSEDQSLPILIGIADINERVTVLSLSRNFGHQAALTAGLDYASSTETDAVLVLDSDLQHPPRVLHDMLIHFNNGADVVFAVRRHAQQLTLSKRVFSEAFYIIFKAILGKYAIRRAADFRLTSIIAVKAMTNMREYHRYLRGMTQWMGFATAIVEYDQPPRFAGKPSYTFRKSLQMAFHAVFSFSVLPLRIISITGCVLAFAGMLYLIFVVYSALKGNVVEGWASVLSATLILSGVQLLSSGIIAEYIGMIFEQSKNRPLYILKYVYRAKPDLIQLNQTHEAVPK